MCQMPGQSSGNMSNELARDAVGATMFGRGDVGALRDRTISEGHGGASQRQAQSRMASRPTSGATILGAGGSSPDAKKTLLGQ